uniref:Uncharacterized protein n=1 Tax=Hyaloperonospora arabidopsidis (strain Emoy2) TaxID=559515 RepID=M4C667_HYAAE
MIVVVWVILDAEREVRVAQELLILVAVRIESAGDESLRADHFAHSARDLGFRARHVTHAHGAVQRQVGAVERPLRLEVLDHVRHQGVEGVLRHPARGRTALRKQRRFDADDFDVRMLARHFHEAGDGAEARAEQRFAARRRTFVDEVVEHGVVRQEGDVLVHEVHHRNADRLAVAASLLFGRLHAARQTGGRKACDGRDGQHFSTRDFHEAVPDSCC